MQKGKFVPELAGSCKTTLRPFESYEKGYKIKQGSSNGRLTRRIFTHRLSCRACCGARSFDSQSGPKDLLLYSWAVKVLACSNECAAVYRDRARSALHQHWWSLGQITGRRHVGKSALQPEAICGPGERWQASGFSRSATAAAARHPGHPLSPDFFHMQHPASFVGTPTI